MTSDLLALSALSAADSGRPSTARVREQVDSALTAFLAGKRGSAPDACLPPLVAVLGEFLEGGKRLRPLFCHFGWLAGGGDPDGDQPVVVGAALELFHTFALVHDDIMDASGLRRGKPTVHRSLAAGFHGPGGRQAAERFGTSAAILLGDLALVWSEELLSVLDTETGRRRAVRELVGTMHVELIAGQYLDLLGAAESAVDPLRRAWRVIRLKTARYTVELPLRIGAVLAGADAHVLTACGAYGRPVGEAFQLRDDLLGVFGDPAVTGKPDLDDLREGKQTVLMILAWRQATEAQREVIAALHGKPDLDQQEADRLREVVRDTGAVTRVEKLIADRAQRALSVLKPASFAAPAKQGLAELAVFATSRTR
ncbi:geranylgeranyl diphosphate synthase, type I [Lentzea albidocapillata subsp. violacea]|uniref:Geranylgeranyl diphosphate synthase, type I n=1 Tax=Lentzea albidocapillata subsp. violacea TaxID=128104 RepID=A0A1G8U2L6_9PSEU|nr:polyprenyl synthetase family protein [Lentzea albidocapillata]SDJ48022.1 geranylgeranyl diphosphate synthase, type I [Lentzea albidocapillata subsp. violacea]